MRFPNPIAVPCLTCGQPTVVAETSTGSLRVHCGTWRWQCDLARRSVRAVVSAGLIPLGADRDQELAA